MNHGHATNARRIVARFRDGLARQFASSQLGPMVGGQSFELREPSLAAWASSVGAQTFVSAGTETARQQCAYVIRPVEPTDVALIAESHARLSDRSKYQRFLGSKPALSPAELRALTNVDHHDRETLIAVNRIDGRAIGTAQYARGATDPYDAEIAIAVIDEWHRRGVATALMSRLIDRAELAGIRQLTALIGRENYASLALLRHLGLQLTLVERDRDASEYRIALEHFDVQQLKRLAQPCS